MTKMAKVYNLPSLVTDVSQRSIPKQSHQESVKVHYSSNALTVESPDDENVTVSNSQRTDYTKNKGKEVRFVVGHYRSKNIQPSSEAGGNTKMSDQLDRQQIHDLIEKELRSHNEKTDLKLELLSTKLDSGLQSVELTLSQKIDSMNASISQTLQEIKSDNALIKKDIEIESTTTQALVDKKISEVKDLINVEKEKLRLERKNDRKYLITTTIATCGIVLTLLIRLFI